MDLDALRFAEFKLLDEAVSDWSKMVDKLDDLKGAAEKGLTGAAKKADWAGYNATVSREFIAKTAGEFDDAHTQAQSISRIMRDTLGELRKHQEELVGLIADGAKKNLTVTSTGGGGFRVDMNIHPDRAAKGTSVPDRSQAEVDAFRDDVQKVLDKATKSDASAATALKAIADLSRFGFADAKYKSRDAAVAATEEADKLSKLAKKNPADLTVAEFDRLNSGLKKYADDELFAEQFATNLGAKGTLEFWADINDPNANPQLNHARHGKFDDLQKHLSLTLATATQSDSLGMTEWTSKVVDLGNKPVGNSGPMGFQVMSNLMRWGNFDDQFLTDYGSRLMETEKRMTGNGEGTAWRRSGNDVHLNRTGSDTGWDPTAGYLKGLSNSPHAATSFFNDEFISKNDENNPFDGKSKSNFQYLFEERGWPNDVNDSGELSNTGRNNLGLALEAATTGHPAGELPPPMDNMPHNAEQAKLMKSLVSSISDDSKRLTEHPYLSDSVGQIASEYLPDINRAMTNDHDRDTDRLFPVAGSEATLHHRDAIRFLFAIGQHSEGYAAVEVGQKSYMANLMEYHLDPDLPTELRYSNPERSIDQIAYGSGEISGTLAIGRQEAVAGPAEASDKEYGEAISQWKNAISGGIGTGIGVGTAYIANPITGAAVGGAASTASSMVLESLFKDAEGQAKAQAGPAMGERWESGLETNSKYSEKGAESARDAHHRKDLDDIGETARIGAQRGFQVAGTNVSAMASDIHTAI
ncbi:hypothetical protein AB0I16_31660 [Streptomyces sp. NPDC050703]|uniref:hypothetical protein n=1 Tax=Streptomyces sp. NPDC050703 TaxID=3157218 RepID=UPI003421D1B2